MAQRIATYILRIMGPEPDTSVSNWMTTWDKQNQEVIDNLKLFKVVDYINDYLPEDYYAKIES